jgi:hypothetical protein
MILRRALSILAAPVLASVALATACSSSDSGTPASSTGGAGGAGGAGGGGAAGGTSCLVEGDKGASAKSPALLGTDCDPLSDRCGLPFPSNVYLVADASGKNPSGKAVQFGPSSLPKFHGSSDPVPPDLWLDSDGFSTGQAPMTHMLDATVTGLVGLDNLDASTKPDSATILMEADTGVLVPHWAELDSAPKHSEERAIMIRPAVRLKDATRYIVAMRRVKDSTGAVIPPTPAFQALRDGTPGCHPSVDLRREIYKDIFGKLDGAGVKKDDLQIAWDYTTATKENNTRWLLQMRDDAFAKYGTKPFKWRFADGTPADGNLKGVESPTMTESTDAVKFLNLKVTFPNYLNFAHSYDQGKPDEIPAMNFGPDGKPLQNGEFEWDVLVHVPRSIVQAGVEPHGILQNGHGLFGSRDEGKNGYMAHMANLHHYVGVAVDFYGFSEGDVPLATAMLGGEPQKLHGFIDRQIQGHVVQLLTMRFMMNQINDVLKDPMVGLTNPAMVDTSRRYYRGDSQGGIMGTAYMAISQDVTRGLLGEPGMPYNLLLNRSKDWPGYGIVLNGAYPDGRDIQILLGLIQMAWDRSEPNGYAPYMSENMLPGTPSHNVLIHAALGDCQVTPIGAELIARTIKAKSLNPAPRPIWGVDTADVIPAGGSGIVEWTFALPDAPITNTPPLACSNTHVGGSDQDPHDKVRRLTPAYDQSDWFFRTGEIKQFCKGICSCYDAMPEDGCDQFPQ